MDQLQPSTNADKLSEPSDCGVEEARANVCRSVRAFCAKMMRGAKGVGMGELLAKKPSIWIMSLCSLYHICYVGISGYSL